MKKMILKVSMLVVVVLALLSVRFDNKTVKVNEAEARWVSTRCIRCQGAMCIMNDVILLDYALMFVWLPDLPTDQLK